MDNWVFTVLLATAGAIYFISAAISVGRMLAGPNSMDRLISLDSMIAMMQGMLAAFMVWRLDTSVVYPMLVIALLGFLSSLAVAKFRVPDEKKGTERKSTERKNTAKKTKEPK